MSEDTGCYVDDVCLPDSWYPVEAGRHAQIFATYVVVVHSVAIGSAFFVKELGAAIVDAISTQVTTLRNASVGTAFSESNYTIEIFLN
jgi:hypothetical protein